MTAIDRLRTIAAGLSSGRDERPVSVRTFLAWFGAQRRGYWIVQGIRAALDETGLETEPDFETAYIDSNIALRLKIVARGQDSSELADRSVGSPNAIEFAAEARVTATAVAQLDVADPDRSAWVYEDPTHSISKLLAANRPPVFVAPNASLAEAVTLLMHHDFSQLPVMTSPRELKGVITWESIGARLALGVAGAEVREFMEPSHELPSSASLFQAVPLIVQYNYVLIRAPDKSISGIVTASDLSIQFQQLAEPFLLLGEIENHIRQMIGSRYTPEELATARDPGDMTREVRTPADLTFGEYIRLLEDPARWQKLGLQIDRATFCRQLDQVRVVRNDVMHFDPDGIPDPDKTLLSDFARFLHKLHSLNTSQASGAKR